MHTLTTEQRKQLGLELLSEKEIEQFAVTVGLGVFENSLARLVSVLSSADQAALEVFIDSVDDHDVLLNHLVKRYPEFSTILSEEENLFITSFVNKSK